MGSRLPWFVMAAIMMVLTDSDLNAMADKFMLIILMGFWMKSRD